MDAIKFGALKHWLSRYGPFIIRDPCRGSGVETNMHLKLFTDLYVTTLYYYIYNNNNYNNMGACLYICLCTTCVHDTSRGRNRVREPLELELQQL